MKILIIMMSLMVSSMALATQVDTECAAMNESREKVIKTVQTKTSVKSTSSSKQ